MRPQRHHACGARIRIPSSPYYRRKWITRASVRVAPIVLEVRYASIPRSVDSTVHANDPDRICNSSQATAWQAFSSTKTHPRRASRKCIGGLYYSPTSLQCRMHARERSLTRKMRVQAGIWTLFRCGPRCIASHKGDQTVELGLSPRSCSSPVAITNFSEVFVSQRHQILRLPRDELSTIPLRLSPSQRTLGISSFRVHLKLVSGTPSNKARAILLAETFSGLWLAVRPFHLTF